MTRGNRPSISRVGHVVHRGPDIIIHGWGLGLCATGCGCHRHPELGHLTILQDYTAGTLGLVSYLPCGCCQPWTWAELDDIVRDTADLQALAHT
jgi:hypothetical protein